MHELICYLTVFLIGMFKCTVSVSGVMFCFLGAARGSPYIVFISTSGMLRSSDIYIYIYIYIYIISVHTCNRNDEFIL